MSRCRYFLVLCFLLLAALPAAGTESTTVLGSPKALSDGARALQMRDFEEGLRLTLEGLREETRQEHRIAAFSNLCAGYVGLRRYDEALAACNQALSMRPTHWRALNNRAAAYYGKGQLQAARRDTEAGLALNPESPKLLEMMELIRKAEALPGATIAAGEDRR